MQDRILAKTKGSIGPEDKIAKSGQLCEASLNETMADFTVASDRVGAGTCGRSCE